MFPSAGYMVAETTSGFTLDDSGIIELVPYNN
jgi:hypothetical protein